MSDVKYPITLHNESVGVQFMLKLGDGRAVPVSVHIEDCGGGKERLVASCTHDIGTGFRHDGSILLRPVPDFKKELEGG